ncbi:MAG TPA: HAD-IC family P-type ATPase, partial [Anaerolineae bacterium]|nr:HAD-IC family P-type ATPase [Anaerolineae bacterium]
MDINYGNQPQESDHAKPSEYLMAELGTSYQGLSQNDASRRLERYGKNLIPRAYRRNAATIALAQFQSPLIYILIVASIIAFVLGDRIEASLIVGIVVVNAALGFIQEYRSEQTLEDLRKYITYRAKVRRDGQEQEIDTTELVPGDIIHLNIGDIVPADAKLIDAEDASVNEAALTGESLPVPKVTVDVAATKPQAERIDTVFMGTIITDGAGTGVVVNTGADTQFGRVALSLREKAPPSEFQIGISQFGRLLLVIILAMTAFIFATNAFFGRGILTSLLFALALAVGITPEALPAIITVTLSRGALYLARSQVITKKLSSIEDLGNMDILCTDKTGTLTKGIVSLENTFGINKEERPDLVVYGVLCNSAVIRRGRLTGNPIDIAVLDYARKNRISTAPWHVIDYNEFDFERRRMSVVARNGKTMLICKGAPESVIEVSSHADIAGEIRPIDQVRDNIEKTYKDMASQGLRLIGIAMKEIEEKPSYTKADELDLTFVGFISFIDAPKRGVRG